MYAHAYVVSSEKEYKVLAGRKFLWYTKKDPEVPQIEAPDKTQAEVENRLRLFKRTYR